MKNLFKSTSRLLNDCSFSLFIILWIFFVNLNVSYAFEHEVKNDTRCTVCGMFVAKYPAWISKIEHKGGKSFYFDGAKDMFVYFFNPEKFGQTTDLPILNLFVKDYYSLDILDGKKAYYVVGSDVYGPMGHEFIPFSSKEAAQAFKKDHHGKEILLFDQITSKRVESMRAGHKMK